MEVRHWRYCPSMRNAADREVLIPSCCDATSLLWCRCVVYNYSIVVLFVLISPDTSMATSAWAMVTDALMAGMIAGIIAGVETEPWLSVVVVHIPAVALTGIIQDKHYNDVLVP